MVKVDCYTDVLAQGECLVAYATIVITVKACMPAAGVSVGCMLQFFLLCAHTVCRATVYMTVVCGTLHAGAGT